MKLDLFGNVLVEEPEAEIKIKKPSPFEYVAEFGSKNRVPDASGYNAWLVNAALSMRKDTVHQAAEMTKYFHLPDAMQRDFYFYGLRKGNYHAKWAKAEKDTLAPIIASYYNVSMRVAKEYLRVLTDAQVARIVDIVENEKGGKKRVK